MPIVEAHIHAGLSDADKATLRQTLADAMTRALPASTAPVSAKVREYPAGADVTDDRASVQAAAAHAVTTFLAALQAREVTAATAWLGPGFAMHFPGARPMTSISALIAWAAPRYRFVTKFIEATETLASDDGVVVYVRGTLRGEWPDGRPFSGIRFIDRFEVKDGLITRQDVWNDLAEVRPR